jgi:hypothetical protein
LSSMLAVSRRGPLAEWLFNRARGAGKLRRIDWVDVLDCRWGGRRARVGESSEREVVVASVVHLGLPTEASPRPRAWARSPAFELS